MCCFSHTKERDCVSPKAARRSGGLTCEFQPCRAVIERSGPGYHSNMGVHRSSVGLVACLHAVETVLLALAIGLSSIVVFFWQVEDFLASEQAPVDGKHMTGISENHRRLVDQSRAFVRHLPGICIGVASSAVLCGLGAMA